MKKIWLLILCLIAAFGLTACDFGGAKKDDEQSVLSENKIYLFYQEGCSHCHDAMKYLRENHADLEIEEMNVADQDNMRKILLCANKFELNYESLGTPLFCMGNHYIMGWSPENVQKFEKYLSEMQK